MTTTAPLVIQSWKFEEGETDETGYPNPDTVIVHFRDGQGNDCSIRFEGSVTYPSERGSEHDLNVSLAEDFLDELAARLGYRVDKT